MIGLETLMFRELPKSYCGLKRFERLINHLTLHCISLSDRQQVGLDFRYLPKQFLPKYQTLLNFLLRHLMQFRYSRRR